MKAIISIMIIIVGVLVFLVVDTDVTDTGLSSEQSVSTSNTDVSTNKETTQVRIQKALNLAIQANFTRKVLPI